MPFQPFDHDVHLDTVMDDLFHYCVTHEVSDLHFEPQGQDYRLRIRQLGYLQVYTNLSSRLLLKIMQRIKILAHLELGEHHKAQDGQFVWPSRQKLHCRVSTCPLYYGEKIVLRLLHKPKTQLSLIELGFLPEQISTIQEILRAAHGLILVNGPTGSGKTTTLYKFLQLLDTGQKNIISIEDPIEIPQSSINQVQLQNNPHLNIAKVLRTVLRQDPDIILIGEIRDQETARLALEAAQTGHLILTSLHSANAELSLRRLKQLGFSEADIHEYVQAIIAQQLLQLATGSRRAIYEIWRPESTHLRSLSLSDISFTLYENGCISYEELVNTLGV